MQTPGFNQPETKRQGLFQQEPFSREIVQHELIYAKAGEPRETVPNEVLSASTQRRKSWTKWLLLAAAAFLIFQFYYIQEMLAILVIFAGIFIVFAIIAGIVYAVGRAGESTITAAEPVARRGVELAEEVSKKTFRRPRSAPVP